MILCYHTIMDLPIDIKQKIEELTSNYNLKDLQKCYNKISSSYLKEEGSNERLVISSIDVLTYAITRMPATFGAVSKSLAYGLENIEQFPNSIIDLGSGTGSSILACSILLPNFNSYTCYEREIEMINFSKYIFEDSRVSYFNVDNVITNLDKKADLVIASYFMNELSDDNKAILLDKIWECSNQFILIVEPGTPKAFSNMRKYRDYFINKGAYVVAPCPHNGACPICGDDWCHFVTRVSRSKLHKLLKNADVPYEDEKFTYLFISKQKTTQKSARILRHPLIKGAQIETYLCKNDGTLGKEIITKSNKEYFKKLKKLDSGDSL